MMDAPSAEEKLFVAVHYCPKCGDAPFNFRKRSRLAESIKCGVCGSEHNVEDYQHIVPYKPASGESND